MKLTLIRTSLSETLQKAGNFISNKINDPGVLKCVFIQTTKKEVLVKTTNVSDYFVGQLGGKVETEGEVLVDYKTLFEIVKTVNEGKINLETKGNNLILSSETGQVTIPLFRAAQFPPSFKLEKNQELSPSLFQEKKLEQVFFSCANDDSRPTLTASCFDFWEGGVRVAATDGFRLSLLELKNKNNLKNTETTRLLVSTKSLISILKANKNQIGKILFSEDEKTLCFQGSENTIYSRLIEGEYPPYEKVIPQTYETRIVFEREGFANALKTASFFARESGTSMISLQIKKLELFFHAGEASQGEANLKINLLNKEGKDNKITFNYRFLNDFLNNFDNENELVLEFVSPFSPGLFYANNNHKNPLHIIMPIRTQEE